MSNIAAYATNQDTVGVTAVQVDVGGFNDIQGVIVKSLAANTGKIYVGQTNAVTTSNGFELNPKEQVLIPVDNADQIWVISDTAAQKVCYLAA